LLRKLPLGARVFHFVGGGNRGWGGADRDARAASRRGGLIDQGRLPVEQTARFELVGNLRTAKALGLTILPAVLTQTEEILQ